jgi:uncharacterized membrane protein YdfJ with MMPL/SSD domain
MFTKLGHAVAHHPWWVIAAWVVAAALIVSRCARDVVPGRPPAEAPTGSRAPEMTSTARTEP